MTSHHIGDCMRWFTVHAIYQRWWASHGYFLQSSTSIHRWCFPFHTTFCAKWPQLFEQPEYKRKWPSIFPDLLRIALPSVNVVNVDKLQSHGYILRYRSRRWYFPLLLIHMQTHPFTQPHHTSCTRRFVRAVSSFARSFIICLQTLPTFPTVPAIRLPCFVWFQLIPLPSNWPNHRQKRFKPTLALPWMLLAAIHQNFMYELQANIIRAQSPFHMHIISSQLEHCSFHTNGTISVRYNKITHELSKRQHIHFAFFLFSLQARNGEEGVAGVEVWDETTKPKPKRRDSPL